MKKAALAFSAFVVASLGLLGAARLSQPDVAAAAKGAGGPPLITVSGTGEVQRKPEFAVVHLGVEYRENNASTASKVSEYVGTRMEKIVKAIEDLGLPGTQLQTSGINLNVAYDWKENRRTMAGYEASSMLRVRVDDPKSVGKIMDAAIKNGANRVDGVSFELKEGLSARQEAIRLAADAAREKAETLAAALGLRIKSVVTATTSSDSPRPWMMANETAGLAASQRSGMGEAIEPGMVTVRAEATVTFAAEERR